MYIEGKAKWIDKIDKALEVYNNRKHSTIKMSPVEKSKEKK